MSENKLEVDGLALGKSEALLVSYSTGLRTWVASVGDLRKLEQRILVTGASAEEALAMLLIELGGKIGGAS